MFPDFNSLPLSPEQSRAGRNYLGLTQAKAAEESGLPAHKIKRFEAGNYIPDVEFLKDFRAFLEKRGYRFEDTPEPGAKAKEKGLVFPAGVIGETTENQGASKGNRPVKTSFHHMRIALTDGEEMGRVLDLIEDNEERLASLLREPVEAGMWSGLSDKSEARHGAVLKLLSENGLLFARLFGRQIGGAPSQEVIDPRQKFKPKTHADLLHRLHADTFLAVGGDAEALERHKTPPVADTLKTAVLGVPDASNSRLATL